MFSLTLQTLAAEFEVRHLSRVGRNCQQYPKLICKPKIGEAREMQLVLEPAAGKIVVVMDKYDAEYRLRAATLPAGAPDLKGLIAKIRAATIPVGSDPTVVVAQAMGQGTVEGANSLIREAVWWLEWALTGAAQREYRHDYGVLRTLLQYIPGLTYPSAEDVEQEPTCKDGDWGTRSRVVVEYSMEQLTAMFRTLLNNPELEVTLVETTGEDDRGRELTERYTASGALWQREYGTMWGPFETDSQS